MTAFLICAFVLLGISVLMLLHIAVLRDVYATSPKHIPQPPPIKKDKETA